MSQYTTGNQEEDQWVNDNFTAEEIRSLKASARLGKKSYDDIIGKLWFRMNDLRNYITVNEPQKLAEVVKLMDSLQDFDQYMAYGNE
jgi:hypothetical protein